MNNHHLIQCAQQGDRNAFDILYRLHYPQIYNTITTRAYPDDVDDLVQNTFMRAFQNIGTFRQDAAFATWLTRIAINVCNTQWRARSISQSHHDTQTPAEYVTDRNTPETQLQNTEYQTIVLQCIQKLPEQHRKAIWLHYIQEHSYEEITRILKVPIGTVKTWLNRGRQELKDLLYRLYGVEWA
jgi:RNA polymerase sigma-70 factor (ECF subfamily)